MNDPIPQLIHPFPEWKGKVEAAFSTRIGGTSTGAYSELNLGFRSGDFPEKVYANWDAVKRKCGLANKSIVLPKMVHGDGLADADELLEKRVQIPNLNLDIHQNHALLEPEGVDAIYSRRPDRLLAVTMADCLTALIFDPIQKTIAAVHAGWRGTQLEILGKTLETLTSKGLINPKDTWVAFGPCLRVESLEVGESVAKQLSAEFVIRKSGKFFFDMPASNKEQAMRVGIPIQQIRDMGGNTMNEPEQYFSYRRDGQASGRLAAFISLC